MNINFVTCSDPQVASFRYHVEIPVRELNLKGHSAYISRFPLLECDTYIFSKHFNEGDYWYMKAVKGEGKKTVFHMCDDHFKTPHRDHYMRMLEEVDSVITTTYGLAESIKFNTGRDAEVIPDTYEFPEDAPKYTGELPIRVLWFGHPFNLRGLKDVIPLPDFCELRMCTRLDDDLPIKNVFAGIQWIPWSHQNMCLALDWSDVVIIPVRGASYDKTRSNNRLMEAVRRGRFVIASDMPSYREFDQMHIGDIHVGLNWLKEQKPGDIIEKIKTTQEYIKDKYNPSKIGELWEKNLS